MATHTKPRTGPHTEPSTLPCTGHNALATALDITASCWVNASAGSGKTTVLVGRIVRLLIHGIEPEAILCLTFTQRAAKEMHHRLMRDMQAMIHNPQADDSRWMLWLGRPPRPEELEKLAHRWQQWDKSPLTIQTFHSFCYQVLSRFPVESMASLPLRLMDAPQAQTAWDQSCQWVVDRCTPDDEHGPLIDFLSRQGVRVLEVLQERGSCGAWMPTPEATSLADLLCAAQQHTQTMADFLVQGWPDVPNTPPCAQDERVWWESCHTLAKGSAAFLSLVDRMKKIKDPGLAQWVKDVKAHITQWRQLCARGLEAIEHQALDRVWWAAYKRYVVAKNGALDFDDLIGYTLRLLDDSPHAGEALHGLHRSYRHILVDEAQDTSVLQWRILRHVMEAVVCGHHRTVFVVGDSKQSIYGFQGADVSHFALMEDFTKAWVCHQAGGVFHSVYLDQSYRSAGAILDLVNAVFDPLVCPNLPMFRSHHSAFAHRQGSVVLLQPEAKERDMEDHVALWMAVIQQWMTHPLYLPSEHRCMTQRDIMILLPRRTSFYKALEEALIQTSLMHPHTFLGGDHPTMQWMAAWLGVAMDPDNDVAMGTLMEGLAKAVGESGQWLWRVAYQRQGASLYQRLRQMASLGDPWCQCLVHYVAHVHHQRHHLTTAQLMTQWVYGDQGGMWLHLLDAHTASVKGAIDAFLSSLQAWPGDGWSFLHWMRTYNPPLEIPSTNGIRLMTIHGAKGAEAPVVIVPDLPDPVNKDDLEHWRLLYVALTRAKDHLIVGSRSSHTPWYQTLEKAMSTMGTVDTFPILAKDMMCWRLGSAPSHKSSISMHDAALPDTALGDVSPSDLWQRDAVLPDDPMLPLMGTSLPVTPSPISHSLRDSSSAMFLEHGPGCSAEASSSDAGLNHREGSFEGGFSHLLAALRALAASDNAVSDPGDSLAHHSGRFDPADQDSGKRLLVEEDRCGDKVSATEARERLKASIEADCAREGVSNREANANDLLSVGMMRQATSWQTDSKVPARRGSRDREAVYSRVHTALLGQCVHQLLDELPCQDRHDWTSVAMSLLQHHGFSPTISHWWTTRIMAILTKEEWGPLFAHPHSLAEVDMSHHRQVRRMDRLLIHDHDAWIVDFKTSSPLDMTHWDQCAYGQQLNEYHQWVQRVYPDKLIHTGLLWVKTGSLEWKPTPYPFRLWSDSSARQS